MGWKPAWSTWVPQGKSDGNAGFLRAAQDGNMQEVLEYLSEFVHRQERFCILYSDWRRPVWFGENCLYLQCDGTSCSSGVYVVMVFCWCACGNSVLMICVLCACRVTETQGFCELRGMETCRKYWSTSREAPISTQATRSVAAGSCSHHNTENQENICKSKQQQEMYTKC